MSTGASSSASPPQAQGNPAPPAQAPEVLGAGINVENLINEVQKIKGMCPMTTNIIYSCGEHYEAFMGNNGLECKASTAMTWAILAVAQINFLRPPAVMANPVTNTLNGNYMNSLLLSAKKWVMELVFCQQSRALSDKNLENYFKSMGSDTVPFRIAHVIDYISRNTPKISTAASAKKLIEGSTFVKYHTGVSTTASLAKRAIDSSPFGNPFTAAEMRAIQAADEDPTNLDLAQKIPARAIVVTSAILTACDQLPKDWYMGLRAVSLYPGSKYSSMVKIYKRAIAVSDGVGNIDTVTGISDLKQLLEKLTSGIVLVDASEVDNTAASTKTDNP